MAIERFIWTDHGEHRRSERGLTRSEIERTISQQHNTREVNRGDADWRLYGTRADGRGFAVIYDHPVHGEQTAVRIVSVWTLREADKSRKDR